MLRAAERRLRRLLALYVLCLFGLPLCGVALAQRRGHAPWIGGASGALVVLCSFLLMRRVAHALDVRVPGQRLAGSTDAAFIVANALPWVWWSVLYASLQDLTP